MEFRRDVAQVARNPEPGVSSDKTVAEFGIRPITFPNGLTKADIDGGVKPGATLAGSA